MIEQRFDAVNTPLEPGITLIEASAGTGKTWSIAALFLRLVLEERVPVQSILAVTYTVAATSELRERVRAKLQTALTHLRGGNSEDEIVAKFIKRGGDRSQAIGDLDLASQSFDEARIFTIHSFCQRVLQDHTFESGSRHGAEVMADSRPMLEEVARDFWRVCFYNTAPHLAALAVARKVTPGEWMDLLQSSRNHPNLRILPERDPEPAEAISREITETLDRIRCEWSSSRPEIEAILRTDSALSQSEKAFRADRVDRLFSALDRLLTGIQCDAECMEAIEALSTGGIAAGTKPKKSPPQHTFFDLCQQFCDLAERYFRRLTHDFLDFAATELPERKLRRNVLGFDDLLTHVHRALNSANGPALAAVVGGNYRAALIDEFQDTDPLQYEIFSRLFATSHHWLFYIGDPKQAIYGFRGADVFTYLTAARDAARRYTLDTNWRSDEALLTGFNAFFTRRADNAPFVVEQIQYHEVHSARAADPDPEHAVPPLRFRYLSSDEPEKPLAQDKATERICDAVAADVAAMTADNGGRWQSSAMAVLVRQHWQADNIQTALRRRGIRSVLHTEESVFHSHEAVELQRLLEAVLSPADNQKLNAALATALIGQNANEIAALDADSHQHWLEQFLSWRDLWRDACFIAMFRRVLAEQGVRRRLMQWPGGERRLTNLLHLAELAHEAATLQHMTPEALLEWITEQRAAERSPSEAAQLRLESDGDAVTIVTIHKSKGLEYPVVFCPFLWLPADSARRQRVQFHDDAGRLTLDLRGKSGADEDHIARHRREALAEEVRLLYVAVTRARHECIIYTGDVKAPHESALGHLLCLEPGAPMLEGIQPLVADQAGSVSCSLIETGDATDAPVSLASEADRATSVPSVLPLIASREFPGIFAPPAFLTSFSGLIAGGAASAHAEAVDPPERDKHLESAPLDDGVPASEAPPDSTDGASPPAPIFQFERGTRAGDFFHDVLESLDFQDAAGLEPVVANKLALHGFPRTQYAGAIAEKLGEVLNVELQPGLRLSRIAHADRLSEVEFSCRLNALRPEDFRDLFSGYATSALVPEELGRLRFSPVEGFLRGFIDLLFHFEGRYYVVDWKSNWLGASPSDYDAAGVNACMRDHHYTLQAMLYVLAADRFLATRVRDYEYERHFGGVFYLFLRGVERDNPSRAIFRDCPPVELIRRLRKLTQSD